MKGFKLMLIFAPHLRAVELFGKRLKKVFRVYLFKDFSFVFGCSQYRTTHKIFTTYTQSPRPISITISVRLRVGPMVHHFFHTSFVASTERKLKIRLRTFPDGNTFRRMLKYPHTVSKRIFTAARSIYV